MERGELEERLDAQFYQPQYLELEHRLRQCPYLVQRLRDLALQIVDGPFGSQLKVEEYVPSGIPLVRVSDVKTGELVDDGLVFITPEKQQQLKRSQVLRGDVILTKAGAILGYSAVFPNRWAEGNITSHSVSIRCKDTVRNRYLSFYLRSEFGNRQIYRWGSKSTRPELNTEEVGHILVVVPPLDVQDAIADKMEAAYQRKRELEAEAEALLGSIDEYLLGKLEIEWPELMDEKHFTGWASEARGGRLNAQYYQSKFVTVSNLLESLTNVKTVGDVVRLIRNGADIRDYQAEGTPYLRVGDIKGGSIVLDEVKFVAAVPDDVPESQRIRAGDALFTRKGSYGNVAAVKQDHESCIISSELIRIVLDQSIDAEYFAIVMNSPVGKLQSERNAVGAVMPGISHPVLRTFKIPLTSSAHQREIVTEVQHRRERAAGLREEAAQVVAEARAEVERMILGE